MSAVNEKSEPSTNVLTITRSTPSHQPSSQGVDILSTIEDNESTNSLTPTPTQNEKTPEREASALSPFYNPNPTRLSLEAQKSESKQNINVVQSGYDTDVEACLTPQKTMASSSRGGGLLKLKSSNDIDGTVWPGQKAMKAKKKTMRKQRNKQGICGCMAGLDRKTRIWIKIVIGLVVVGGAIGVGIGISKAVGGGVWKSKSHSNAPIDGTTNTSG